MPFCGKCGTKLETGARFCPSCGAAVDAEPGETISTAAVADYVPKKGLISAFKKFWSNFYNFTGVTSVADCWFAILANVILGLLLFCFECQNVGYMAAVILTTLVPTYAMYIRRIRDSGNSWAKIFMMLIPLAGPIILIVMLCKATADPQRLAESEMTYERECAADVYNVKLYSSLGAAALLMYFVGLLINTFGMFSNWYALISNIIYAAIMIAIAIILLIKKNRSSLVLLILFGICTAIKLLVAVRSIVSGTRWHTLVSIIFIALAFISMIVVIILNMKKSEAVRKIFYLPGLLYITGTVFAWIVGTANSVSKSGFVAVMLIGWLRNLTSYLLVALGLLCIGLVLRDTSGRKY